MRGGDVDVVRRVHAGGFQHPQRRFQFVQGLFGAAGLAVEHGQVVVQGRHAPVGGGERGLGRVDGLAVQVLGLIVPARGPHAGGRVDQRGGPSLGALQSHA